MPLRRRWRWNPDLNQLVEVSLEENQAPRSHEIMTDIEPFKSPVDGTIVSGRRALRDHNKRNNVTNAADFKETWEKARKERESFYSGESKYDRAARIDALKHAWEKHRRR